MKIVNRNENMRQWLQLTASALLVAGLVLVTGELNARQVDVGAAVEAAVGNQQSTVAGQGQAAMQNPTQRGVNQAVRGVVNGQNPGDAIRSGVNEGLQSASETPQQTQQRIQTQGQIQANQPGQPMVQGNIQGQAWQRDAQGRSYYLNSNGQAIYGQPGQQGQPWHQGQQGQQGNNQSTFGANFQSYQNGIGVSSIQAGSVAANAGLRQGDVLVKVDGEEVQGIQSLDTRLNQLQADQQAKLLVMRNGQYYELTAKGAGSAQANQQTHTNRNSQTDNNQDEMNKLRSENQRLRKEIETWKAKDKARMKSKNSAGVSGDAQLDASRDAKMKADAKLDVNRSNE